MKTIQAFAMGEANRDKEMMVFDWVKAATIIKERQPEIAGAGLHSDWEWTGGTIFRDGKPVPKENTYTFLASTWATPELDIGTEIIDCYIMESVAKEMYGDVDMAKVYWPQIALDVLNPPKPVEEVKPEQREMQGPGEFGYFSAKD